jgi:AcrR family transcriptional regulator
MNSSDTPLVMTSAPRRPGRPRDDHAEQAILDAVVELLGEQGFTQLTIGGVAARAGVGKPTLYRRWPSKAELVVDAIARLAPPAMVRRSGDPRADLRRVVRAVATELINPPLGATVITLLSEMHADPGLTELVQDRLAGPRRRVLAQIVEDAVKDGLLRPDTDVEMMLDLTLGSLVFRWLTTGKTPPPSAMERTVDVVWDAFTAD